MGLDIFGSTEKKTDQPVWIDPLGYSYKDPEKGRKGGITYKTVTGATDMRDKIFGEFDQWYGQGKDLNQRFIGGALDAARNPAIRSTLDVANRTARGDYLGYNPYVENALKQSRAALGTSLDASRRRALSDYSGATQSAQSAYSRAGLGFSTANQQAAQASKAALLANLADQEAMAQGGLSAAEAQARLQSYQTERDRQMMAGQVASGALADRLNYLNAAADAPTRAAGAASNIITSLSSGGQVATPQSAYIQKPGVYDYLLGTVSSLSGGGMQGGGGGW